MITRFEYSICRYDQEDVICRVFALIGFPPAPSGTARACVEDVLQEGGFIEAVAATVPHGNGILAQRAKLALLLELLDVPSIMLTPDQVKNPTLIGRTLCIASKEKRSAVEVHAGIGVLFHHGENGTLTSQSAPITGPGMDMRRDYLRSVVEAARSTMEQQFS